MQGLQMFSDVGIGPAIVQSPRGDDRVFLDTAWTVQAFRGISLWLLSCALAVPFATFYEQPMLGVIIPIAGIGAVLDGFEATSVKTAQRHMRAGRLAAMEIGSQVAGVVVAIAMAMSIRASGQSARLPVSGQS